jgi:hypothetical protein
VSLVTPGTRRVFPQLGDDPMMMTSKHRRDRVESQNPAHVDSRDTVFEHDIALYPPRAQLTARGAPEAAEWRTAITTLLHELNLPDTAPILCDVRAVTSLRRSVGEELLRLVTTRRVAFVAHAGVAPRLAKQISSPNRQDVQIFTDYETALRWLLYADDTFRPSKNDAE